ncbi:unnamed protein product [Effrenium voratum]|nr:unnamed protein product [Effrenium voratum]
MRLLLVAAFCSSAFAGLPPAQQEVVDSARNASKDASEEADKLLLARFGSHWFRWELMRQGDEGRRLASLSAQQLLEEVKAALQDLEWVTNFGLDADSLKDHPGESALGLKTVDAFQGRFPSIWELKTLNSSIVANVSQAQWGILEAAETGLYGLPAFQRFAQPTEQEARLRPRYLAGNTRKLALGVQRYGAMAAVLRDDVVRERGLVLGADTGGWESVCNKSVTPVHKPDWIMKIIEDLSLRCEPVAHTPLGVAESNSHSFWANSQTFQRVGGGLARLVYQLLGDDVDVRPIEGNMYLEAALLGDFFVNDSKVIVGSFPGLFGTEQGEELRSFCRRHGVPLAWALGNGRAWPAEEAEKWAWLPWEPFEFWKNDGERLLDPMAGWELTTEPKAAEGSRELWKKVWEEVAQRRRALGHREWLQRAAIEAWWSQIKSKDIPVRMQRRMNCKPADMCFGTIQLGGASRCICRASPSSDAGSPPIVV